MDEIYQNIYQKKAFYIFGAGVSGKRFYDVMCENINIVGYIDNDIHKAGMNINGLLCSRFSDVEISVDVGIIVAISTNAQTAIIEQLCAAGLLQNIDFFTVNEFVAVMCLVGEGNCTNYMLQQRQTWRDKARAVIEKSRQFKCRRLKDD